MQKENGLLVASDQLVCADTEESVCNIIGEEMTVEMIHIPRYYSFIKQLTMQTHKPDEGKDSV